MHHTHTHTIGSSDRISNQTMPKRVLLRVTLNLRVKVKMRCAEIKLHVFLQVFF